MSTEKPYLLKWYNGNEQISIIPFVYDDSPQICNICWSEVAHIVISKMLSSEIWSPPTIDTYMHIGYTCIHRYVSVNVKHITFRILGEVNKIPADVADLIVEYL